MFHVIRLGWSRGTQWGFSRALHWIRWRLDFLHRPVRCPQLKTVELNEPLPVEKISTAWRAVEVGGGNSTLLKYSYNHGVVVAIVDAALMPFTWEISTVLCRTQLNFTSTDDFSTSSSGGHGKSPYVKFNMHALTSSAILRSHHNIFQFLNASWQYHFLWIYCIPRQYITCAQE